MKNPQRIEMQRWKSASNTHGLVEFRFDGLFVSEPLRDDRTPAHVLSMSEADARALMLLLKAQLAEFDKRKARSQR